MAHMTYDPYNMLRGDALLTPGEVAKLFRVDPKTVGRWAKPHPVTKEIRLPAARTPGGHRRFRASDVRALLEEHGMEIGGGGDGDNA